MTNVPECFYRVSVKALVLSETKDKFLICEDENGVWELPGGGLDWGSTPQEEIKREIREEMGLVTTKVADNPSYFVTGQTLDRGAWIANVVYETELEHLNFTPSDECVSVKFVNKNDLKDLNAFTTVKELADIFNPDNHR